MNYPKSNNKKIRKLTSVLIKYAEKEGLEFSFGGEDLYPIEAFSFFGGLSLFLIEAKETYEKMYNNLYTIEDLMNAIGRHIQIKEEQKEIENDWLNHQKIEKLFPVEFFQEEEDGKTFFGFIPEIHDDIPSDFFTLVHFAQYTVDEYVKIYKKKKELNQSIKIPLEPLYEKMVNKINQNKITIYPKTNILKKEGNNN